ncbi:hypothetical protein PENNAL_c0079G06477, partial [Penicillium nalgiovense]
MLAVIISWFFLALLAIRLVQHLYSVWKSPNRSVPGPWLARYTRLWYFYRVYSGNFHHENIQLHNHYHSRVVRVAPNMYSISQPDKAVYGIGVNVRKSDWYDGWKHPSPDRWSLFPERNIKRHAETRRKFQNIYSLSSLVSYEKYVDDCGDIFTERLVEIAASGQDIDLGYWLRCYAFDVIGQITYSKRFGFLDAGEDVGGLIKAINKVLLYGSLVGIYVGLHPITFKIMQYLPGSGASARMYLTRFVRERVAQREAERDQSHCKAAKKQPPRSGSSMPEDFLNKIFGLYEDGTKGVTKYHVFMMGQSNIVAGSDTTAVSLSSILYHLLRNPKSMQTLRAEIAELGQHDGSGTGHITFRQTQEMRYLQAVIKEGLRLHPVTGLPLWREVPETGAYICGRQFCAGDVVGINSWVAHYDESVWGSDVHLFRPERWLEADQATLRKMESHYMP